MDIRVAFRGALAAAVMAAGPGLSLVAASPAAADVAPVRIGTAAGPVSDSAGVRWSPVRGFTGGRPAQPRPFTAVAGTLDDTLYQTARVGMAGFRHPVPAGEYDVTVRAAERFWAARGQRVFSVTAEGRTVLRDVDIVAAVGRHRAYDRTFRVQVRDGALDLGFAKRVDQPIVSAVRIAPVAARPARPATTRPGPGNTGVPPGTVLRPHYGNLTITTPGARYDSLDIHGFVTVKAPNVTITRSIVRGGRATTNIGLVTNYTPTATNFVIEDSELVPAHPSVWIDGIKGSNYTARRVDVHGTNDNVKVHGNNVRVEDSWLHDTVYRLKDPNLNNTPSHNDGVQVLGGTNIRIIGNDISGAHNAGLQVTQDYSATTDLQFTGNWVDGGGCSVNLAHKKRASMSGITVRDNRFGRHTRIVDCAIISSKQTALSSGGNVWHDNGRSVRIRNGG